MKEKKTGTLYVVATPIGNLKDITLRAIDTLKTVDAIACEDTRKTQILLNHLSIENQIFSLHEHNENERLAKIIDYLERGLSIALVSDAGTPLISDPGFWLVKNLADQGFNIVPVPGPSALIAALSAAGLETKVITFAGFLPRKASEQEKTLLQYKPLPHTLIFYEAPHRLIDTLKSLQSVLGNRNIVIARELTKIYEEFVRGKVNDVIHYFSTNSDKCRGEMVILIEGNKEQEKISADALRILTLLNKELPLNKAAALTSKITGIPKNKLYQSALEKK